MKTTEAIRRLAPLGFTETEAAAYAFLLEEPGSTGYAVSRGIGKGVAHTYRVIDSLEAKGAVMIEESDVRACAAVPPGILLAQLEADFRKQLEAAAQTLHGYERASRNDRIYRLTQPEQVFARARAMSGTCTSVLLVDAFPSAVAEVADALAAAAARGVEVFLLAYEPVAIPGVAVTLHFRAAAVRANWDGSWLNVAADGAEYMVSLMDAAHASVRRAVWTGSAFLAHLYDSGLAAEIAYSRLRQELEDAAADSVAPVVQRLDALMSRLGAGADVVRDANEPGRTRNQ